MRAKGDDRVKEFKGGVVKQREKLNTHVKDHNQLVQDVADIERKLNNIAFDGELRMVVVDLGTLSQEVQFVYARVAGEIEGTVAAIDAAESA